MVVQCLRHKWKLNLSCSYLLTHNRLPCAWALIPGLSPMCCKNRQLTDHFPWQKEIAEGHARASPGSFPAAVREVTELGNLLVFRSLPGAEYWWAAPGAWWQALPAGDIPSCHIKLQKWVLLAFPWPVSINFCRSYLHLHWFIWNQNQAPFWGSAFPSTGSKQHCAGQAEIKTYFPQTLHKVQGSRKSQPQTSAPLNA